MAQFKKKQPLKLKKQGKFKISIIFSKHNFNQKNPSVFFLNFFVSDCNKINDLATNSPTLTFIHKWILKK